MKQTAKKFMGVAAIVLLSSGVGGFTAYKLLSNQKEASATFNELFQQNPDNFRLAGLSSANAQPVDLTQAAETSVHAVVHIRSTQLGRTQTVRTMPDIFDFFFGDPRGQERQVKTQPRVGFGSGVIISKDGYIVTNHHVIENATSILVRTRSGDEYNAQLIGSDQQSDLAVLKIDASGLTPAVLGDSTKLEVGDLAVVIGNPLGELGGTVTSGIISALDREVTIDGQVMTLMQTDAAVNPGNSGGGLFDANGDLVGIINAKSSGNNVEGLGFAIPISNATDIIDELIANGEVTSRPTLGVSLYEVTDANSAAQLGVDSTGVYIVQIVQGGSADLAGLQTGDRIVSVDGTEITSADEVRAALNEHSTGDQMNMVIERNGDTIEVRVSL